MQAIKFMYVLYILINDFKQIVILSKGIGINSEKYVNKLGIK